MKDNRDTSQPVNNEPKKKSHFGFVLATTVVLGVAVASYGTLQSEVPEQWCNDTTTGIVSVYSGRTVLDEVVNNYNINNEANLLTSVDNIEALLDLSERLHDLNLSEIVSDLNVDEVTDYNFSREEVEADINKLIEYQNRGINGNNLSSESEDYLRLAISLYQDEQRVNYSLQSAGFNDIFQLGLRTIKSKVADSCDFDPSSVNNMVLTRDEDGNNVIVYTGDTGKKYTLHFEKHAFDFLTSGSYVSNYVDNLFLWQNNSFEPSTSYDEGKNNRLRDAINTTKTLIRCECTITNSNELRLSSSVAINRIKSIGIKKETE